MAAGIDPRASFLNCDCCARCRCRGSCLFYAVRRAGVRPHGRGFLLAGYHGRPLGRLRRVAALRAAFVQPHCCMAARLVRCEQQRHGHAVAHMGMRTGSLGPLRVSGTRADYMRGLARFLRVLNTIISFHTRRSSKIPQCVAHRGLGVPRPCHGRAAGAPTSPSCSRPRHARPYGSGSAAVTLGRCTPSSAVGAANF